MHFKYHHLALHTTGIKIATCDNNMLWNDHRNDQTDDMWYNYWLFFDTMDMCIYGGDKMSMWYLMSMVEWAFESLPSPTLHLHFVASSLFSSTDYFR